MKVGFSKTDITAYKEGVGMLGYGKPSNIMKSIATRLYARTFVFEMHDTKVAYVLCELCFITQSLKKGVLEKLNIEYPHLGYQDHNLLITAQHTHSAPGGFSFYGLYNAAAPGFVREIYMELVDKITLSIVQAEQNKKENVQLAFAFSAFEEDKEVGFQRSPEAYLQNPEALRINDKTLHLGIDRNMYLMKLSDKDEKPLGIINWFGTHTTSMSNDNTAVSSDNKGYAAQYLEESFGNDFLAAFAQGTCGDVTPKFTYNPKRHFERGKWDGKFENDTESAQYNGKLQFEKAKEILDNKELFSPINVHDIDSGLMYVDFGNIQVSPKFTNGVENVRTSPSCMGVSFFAGTVKDGPGMTKPLYYGGIVMANIVKWLEYSIAPFKPKEWRLTMLQKYYAQGKKSIVIESGARKILGTYNVSRLIVPQWADETVYALKEFYRKGAFDKHPWTQQVLPLQILKIGTIAFAAFPFEVTTIAGKRLQKTLEDILLPSGYTHVMLCPYSNSYAAYITTYEEYQVQKYEGGHTVFGEYSLAALQTEFEKLALEMLKPVDERNLNRDVIPRQFTENDLEGFKHYQSKVYKKYLKQKAKLEKKNA